MKLKIGKGPLLDILQILQGISPARNPIPILSNFLLKAEKTKIWMTASNLDVTVRCGMVADVAKTGATTIPSRHLMSIVRELPAEEIEIEVDEKNSASIRCGAAFFKIVGLAADEFPPLPDFESSFTFSLEQAALKDLLKNVVYGASTDEARYILNGVLLSFKGDKLTVVATDGRRLALVEKEMEFPKEAECEIILPIKAVTELLHALKDEGQVKIRSSGNQIAFEFDDVIVVSKLIDGSYPNYRQVIPSQADERIAIERELLLTTVRRVSLMTNEKANSIKLNFSKNKLKISAITPELGESHETISVKYTGKDISVAFNPEYLMDPLRALVADEIFLEISDELSPGVITSNIPFLYVLMPLRLN